MRPGRKLAVSFPPVEAPLKHRWNLDQNYLTGITAGKWWRLLRENRFAVDPAYWHRGAFITILSFFNSVEARREERLLAQRIEQTVVKDPPVFVLGHWRTGTTHLHNMLSRDPQFAYPNAYEVIHPWSFLTTEQARARNWAAQVRGKRPMDDMAVDAELPQEDEIALALSCLRSPDLVMSFPRHRQRYERYLTFQGVPAAEVEEFKRTLRWYVKKLTLKHARPLVLKSPPHTARIGLLLELFPEARFVNIHREPYTVFLSCRHTNDTLHWYTYLQKPDLEQVDDAILRTGRLVFDAFFAQRHLIPAGRLVDVAYEELEARPVEVVEGIYQALGLPGFAEFRPRLQTYLDSLAGYRKNRFEKLDPSLTETVARAWRPAFEEWGYPA